MLQIQRPVLKLTRKEGGMVDIDFTYDAYFPFAEMQLTKSGVIFVERVDILGVDPPGGTTGQLLGLFSLNEILNVPSGDELFPKPVAIILRRTFPTKTVTRVGLDEDPSPFPVSPEWDPDEIRCRVEIKSLLPTAVGFSNQEVLGIQPPVVLEGLENVQIINSEVKSVEFNLAR